MRSGGGRRHREPQKARLHKHKINKQNRWMHTRSAMTGIAADMMMLM